jgi:NAD(P)-dependent dehydrogenase (short-subunit alcohol dehydrogenase family)
LTPATLGLGDEFLERLLVHNRTTRHGAPEDIAAMVAMLFSDDAAYVTGQTIAVDGGLTLRQ